MAEPPKVGDSLSFLINKLAQLAGRGMAHALAPLGVHARESGIIAAIGQFGPVSQGRIGELLAIDRTTMVVSVDHLEQLGLVERTVHPTDRRVFLIELTPAGRAAIGEAKTRLDAFEAELLAPLSGPEAAAFREMVFRLVAGVLDPAVRDA